MSVEIGGQVLATSAYHSTKKQAKQQAARFVVDQLQLTKQISVETTGLEPFKNVDASAGTGMAVIHEGDVRLVATTAVYPHSAFQLECTGARLVAAAHLTQFHQAAGPTAGPSYKARSREVSPDISRGIVPHRGGLASTSEKKTLSLVPVAAAPSLPQVRTLRSYGTIKYRISPVLDKI